MDGNILRLGRWPQAWPKVMAAYDWKSPASWLPVHRDQLRAKRSVMSMGELYLLSLNWLNVNWLIEVLNDS